MLVPDSAGCTGLDEPMGLNVKHATKAIVHRVFGLRTAC